MVIRNNIEKEIGFVVAAKQYVLTIEGAPSARVHDLLVDENGNRALVQSLARDHVTALALDSVDTARPGDRYTFWGRANMFSLGEHLFGRVMHTLGRSLDGGDSFPPNNTPLSLQVDAVGISARDPVKEQLHTGVTLVDMLKPIAKGQRQLIFGPMHSGKTTFLADVVTNQRDNDMICIYTAIGKPVTELAKIIKIVLGEHANPKTIVIAASSDDPPPVIALAPAVAFLTAEYFSRQNKDVLIVLDDLTTHAKNLREIALLEGRLPGRESYPGDIFYQHAQLMERSGSFSDIAGGGSITTLPVIETEFKNFSDLIPTNLMSCTDGHLSFAPFLRAEGVYPAINEEESVTRVGRQAQYKAQKELGTRVQMVLGEYRRQQEYTQFGAEVSGEVKNLLHRGEIILQLLQQEPNTSIPIDVQVPLMALAFTPFLLEKNVDFLIDNKENIIRAFLDEPELQEFRIMTRHDSGMEDLVAHLERKVRIFERVCQQ